MSWIKNVLVSIFIFPIRVYKFAISPLLGNNCRHYPSCSTYTIEALKTHGVFWGLLLGIGRIMRCAPWGTEGIDPVPPQMKGKQIWKFIISRKKYIPENSNNIEYLK